MTGLRLARRLFAGLAGLTLGLAGVIATAAPAQATSPLETKVEYGDVCHGTYVAVIGGSEQATYQWTITTDRGESYWPPLDEAVDTPAGERILVFVPHEAGKIIVTYEGAPAGWPKEYTWTAPPFCAQLSEPTATAATCDTDAQIAIPELLERGGPADRIPVVPRDPMPTAVQPQSMGYPSASPMPREPVTPPGSGDAPEPPVVPAPTPPEQGYRLNGESVEPGSIHTVAPGTHYVELVISGLTIQVWEITIPAPECEDPGDEPGDEPGEGGELPITGSTTTLIAGGAVLLLAVGAGVYLVARRRRVTFTA